MHAGPLRTTIPFASQLQLPGFFHGNIGIRCLMRRRIPFLFLVVNNRAISQFDLVFANVPLCIQAAIAEFFSRGRGDWMFDQQTNPNVFLLVSSTNLTQFLPTLPFASKLQRPDFFHEYIGIRCLNCRRIRFFSLSRRRISQFGS
mgnify:CR=1 FL=1